MKGIVACEKSQEVARAFVLRGHDFRSCDLLPCEHPEWGIPHIQDDIRNHLNEGYDILIAHPDCTTKANSGVQWLFKILGRYEQMIADCQFFNELLDSKIPKICIEHPIIHKYARQFIRKYDQIIQPHYFIGSNESKATCLWLVGLQELQRTQWLDKADIKQSVWRHAPGPERKVDRARTDRALAKAMATQWG